MIPIDKIRDQGSVRKKRIRLAIQRINAWKKRRKEALREIDPVQLLRGMRSKS